MLLRKCVTEFIGTFFLVLTICLFVEGNRTDMPSMLAPVAIASVLMVMVYMGGHISGAHYNPAVSVAVLLRGKLPLKDFVPYVVSQLIGAMCASLLAYAIVGNTVVLAPAPWVSPFKAVLVEFIFTFALALVVLNVATSEGTKGNSFYGLAIGFTVLVGAVAAGGISGGAFNPAVGIGPTFVHAMLGNGSMTHLWIYIVGPVFGAILATVVFTFQNGTKLTIDKS